MKIPIVITGVSGGGVGRQCIKALRMGKEKYRIIGTDISPYSLGLYTVDKAYLVPEATSPEFIGRLIDICHREKAKVIIPGSEIELMAVSQNREEFARNNILPLINNHQVISACLDKWQTYKLLKKHGFDIPFSYLPKNASDIKKSLHYPVVVKPYVGGGGSRGVFIAQTDAELKFFIGYLMRQGTSVIIQEYVGSPDEEYTVGVLHDLDNKLLGSFALKRFVKGALSIKQAIKDYKNNNIYTISTGISQGTVDSYPQIRRYCERAAKTLGSTGPLNFQCRKVGKKIFIFEINPRFSGTTSIRALCGYNEPETLIRKYLLKKKIGKISYKSGVILRDLENQYINFTQIDKLQSLNNSEKK